MTQVEESAVQPGISTPKTQEVGGVVDDFSRNSVNGGTQSLCSFLEGRKGAVVVFWSGICSHCVRYDPYFNAFGRRHPELGFVAVASRHGETIDEIRKTVAERGLSFPILHDPGGVVARQWFTQQTPRAFLIDSNRTLLYRGAIDNYKYPDDPQYSAYLEPAISEFLSGKAITRGDTPSFGCAIQSVYYTMPKQL
jgi:thiol-disulfide isomerase/thioredoxin